MNVGSKLGLYEFLTMFVSGALILFILVSLVDTHQCHCGCSNVLIEIEGWNVFLFSVFSFTFGVLWHRLVECVRKYISKCFNTKCKINELSKISRCQTKIKKKYTIKIQKQVERAKELTMEMQKQVEVASSMLKKTHELVGEMKTQTKEMEKQRKDLESQKKEIEKIERCIQKIKKKSRRNK